MRSFATSLTLLLAACGSSGAPEIAVSNAWARPTLSAAQPGGVYLQIANSGQAGDTLQAVASDRARASLHNSTVENGVVRMRPLANGVAIPAGSRIELKPNGMHIMIEGLGEPLKAGSTFPLTLRFQTSGERQVQVEVADAPASGHAGH